ncbi:MAG: hypothetical protein IJ438_12625 [Clostridia bacterium]|nr:hypothetical protein [Clostridia bacterium]
MKRMLTVLLAAMLLLTSASAETLKTFQMYVENPPVEVKNDDAVWYDTAEEMAGALVAGGFDYDVFYMSPSVDAKVLMEKGYCLDLSPYEDLMAHFDRLLPSIQAQCTLDGKVYALPHIMWTYIICANPAGWEAAGLDIAEAPSSMVELLDFLEDWCVIAEENPDIPTHVLSYWVSGLYHEGSYVEWLTNLIIESWMVQKECAGEPLRFNDPALLALLERAEVIGKRLYHAEYVAPDLLAMTPETQNRDFAQYSLFTEVGGNYFIYETGAPILYQRIDASQPALVEAQLDMYAIHAGSSMAQDAVALLAYVMDTLEEEWALLLYADAQPLRNEDYESAISTQKARIAALEEQLKNKELELDVRYELEDELSRRQALLTKQAAPENMWRFSAEELAAYQEMAAGFYYSTPGVLDVSREEGRILLQLQERFARGQMTAQAFLQEVDRMAAMLIMENQ